jgi:DNA-binding transcriptional LysR family regulator
MMIDLVQLRTFVAVAEEQHLTRAAERIHISLSSASAHIRGVEDALGTQLFVRTKRSLVLTRAGEMLFKRAKALLNEAALLQSFSMELRGQVEGTLVVGATSEPSAGRMGKIAVELQSRHPLVSLDLRARPSSGLQQGLKNGELDIGMLIDRPTNADFHYYELTTIRFRIAGPIAWKERIEGASWAELAGLPWITPSASSQVYAALRAQLFEDKGLVLNSVIQIDNAALGREMLRAGAGMMLIREEHAIQGEKEGLLAISDIATPDHSLFMIHLASRKNDPLIQAFVDAAYSAWPEMKLHIPQHTR